MVRHDYAYPFAIDPASGQVAHAAYEAHIAQMVRLVLLTDPGERINLPEFGCGLRRLLFAPMSEALSATTRILVMQSLTRWLGDQIDLREVEVSKPDEAPEGELHVTVTYQIVETRTMRQDLVRVG